jgi:hypothetical protein
MPNWITTPPTTMHNADFEVVSGTHGDSTIATHGGHTNLVSGTHGGSESDLLLTGLEAELVVSEKVSASGPGAEAPAVAGIDFERVWRAYGRYGNKQASRRAFDTIINPDVDHIAKRAAAWAASAKPGQRRMPLEKWLAAEKYDEADRSGRQSTVAALEEEPDHEEEVAVGRKRDSVDAAQAAEDARAVRRAAIEIHAPRNVPLTVMDAHLEQRSDGTWLMLKTDRGDVAVLVEGGTGRAAEQEEGQAHLGRLADACGIKISEPEDLCGKTFMMVDDTFVSVARAA